MKLGDEGRKVLSDKISARRIRRLGEVTLKRIELEQAIIGSDFRGAAVKKDLDHWCKRVLECHRYIMAREPLEKLLENAEMFAARCVAHGIAIPEMARVRKQLEVKILAVENTYPDRATNKGNKQPRKKRPRS